MHAPVFASFMKVMGQLTIFTNTSFILPWGSHMTKLSVRMVPRWPHPRLYPVEPKRECTDIARSTHTFSVLEGSMQPFPAMFWSVV